MGNSTTSKADTTKITHCGKNESMQFICMQMRGWRKQMQDSAIYDLQIQTSKSEHNHKNSLFAVFDGHGTSYISRFLKQNFVKVLTSLQQYKQQKYADALDIAFKTLDQMMLTVQGQKRLKIIKSEEDQLCEQGKYQPVGQKIGQLCGSTANVVLVTPNHYYTANTGDSRSILCRNGYTMNLSKDHKPENPVQLKRIKKANGFISRGRVNDMLSVSRAFGDFQFKRDLNLKWDQQIVTCKPDIQIYGRSSRDQFLLIACDGIWQNSQKSKTIVELFIKQKSFKKQNYQLALEHLLNKLIAKDQSNYLGQDNMTALFVKFNSPHEEQKNAGNSFNGENRLSSESHEKEQHN